MDHSTKRILIVDTDSDFLHVLGLYLIGGGYAVSSASNGLAALEQLEKRLFDAVVTEYNISVMNGLDLLSIVRMKWPSVPIVVCSAEGTDTAFEAVDRGAYAWIRKGSVFPTVTDILATAIHTSVHA